MVWGINCYTPVAYISGGNGVSLPFSFQQVVFIKLLPREL